MSAWTLAKAWLLKEAIEAGIGIAVFLGIIAIALIFNRNQKQ